MNTSQREAEAPGLVAVALYLRPARRAEVAGALIELGMFVREFSSCPLLHPGAEEAEVFVVFADDDLSHIQAVERIVRAGRFVLVVVPRGDAAQRFQRLGVVGILSDSEPETAFRQAFAGLGQLARQQRSGQPASPRSMSVFGGLKFDLGEPLLASRTSLAGLSPTEHEVLRALAVARGVVVTKSRLCHQLSGSSEPATDGYLKTVVLRIRRKVATLGGDPTHLAAVRGAGYVLR